jgi:hypothetical protein
MALLFRDFDKRVEIRSTREGLIRFHRMSEAVLYLRKNCNRPGVIATLRQVLTEHHRLQVWRLSDQEVIDEVARRLLNGSLQLMEMFEPRVKGATTPQEEPQVEEPPAVEPARPAAAVPAAAVIPAVPPLLPLLEEVQIEGAEVLPEIMQTLEQIDLTMASIDLAAVSLEPAPSGVPAIGSAMQQVSSSVTTTLDGM